MKKEAEALIEGLVSALRSTAVGAPEQHEAAANPTRLVRILVYLPLSKHLLATHTPNPTMSSHRGCQADTERVFPERAGPRTCQERKLRELCH